MNNKKISKKNEKLETFAGLSQPKISCDVQQFQPN